jgi:hypothetical protein
LSHITPRAETDAEKFLEGVAVVQRGLRELKFAILEILAKEKRAQNRYNMIGRPHQIGSLEYHLSAKFASGDRTLAGKAFDELQRDGLVEPTYADLERPGDWLQLTVLGEVALERCELDDLDGALHLIDQHLVEIRSGAWAAAWSAQPDALRQAAHSGRELIDQTLKALAPDDAVEAAPDFRPDPSARNGITRRHRISYAMRNRKSVFSDSDAKIADKACDLVLAIDDKLMAFAHGRSQPLQRDIVDALQAAEIALRRIVL